MVHRADPPARPVGEYIADQDQGRGRGDKAGAEAAMRHGPEASGRCRAARPASQTAEVAATAEASMAPRRGVRVGGGVGAGAPPDLGQTRRRAEAVAARGRGGAGGGGIGARGREAGEAEGGGCAPRAALDGAAAMAAEAEGQHGVVGRGLAEGLRDFFFAV